MPAIGDRLSAHYGQLSDKLKQAADFVAENPLEVATRSLRSVAEQAGLSPATFSRLAKALDYESYEELREEGRLALSDKIEPFSERAKRLRGKRLEHHRSKTLETQVKICQHNISALAAEIDEDRLRQAAQTIMAAKNVYLVGSLGSSGLLDYLAYMTGWFTKGWHNTAKNSAMLPSVMANVDENDAVIVLSIIPFARRSVAAANIAMEKGAKVIVITNSHTFPGLTNAHSHFLVHTDSSYFFSSYAAITTLLEALVSMMVSLTGEGAENSISQVEKEIRRLEEI